MTENLTPLDHSSAYIAEVKNSWNFVSIIHTFLLLGVWA
jgi:hypothetical protein